MSSFFRDPARLGAVCLLLAAVSASTGCETLTDVLGTIAANAVNPEPEIDEPPPPPPISGGTLLVTRDNALAVAADTEDDRVFVIDLATNLIRHDVYLAHGDEPGRVVEGPEGTAYVALRSGGAVVAVDLESGETTRRDVCPAPRGLAFDAAKGELHVACAGGELVTLSSDLGAAPLRTLHLDRDLRDVVVHGDKLLVSRFRAAELLIVSKDGKVEYNLAPTPYTSPRKRYFEPSVAWRMVPVTGGAAIVHQRAFADAIPTGPSSIGGTYYGGSCDQVVVHAAVTIFDADQAVRVTASNKGGVGSVALPVDMAISAEGKVAVLGAGSSTVIETTLAKLTWEDAIDTCSTGAGTPAASATRSINAPTPVAVAYAGSRLLVQGRVGGLLSEVDEQGVAVTTVPFPDVRQTHSGHTLFHSAASSFSPVACASCHPEGREDGRVWRFQSMGERRTQNMSGGVLDTAPLHWDGDMTSLDTLMGEVFVNRMGGAAPTPHMVDATAEWMQSIAALPAVAPRDEAAAEAAGRGEALFNDPKVGCASCHAGERLTNNATVDVGTGKAFQVPSLVGVADRAPFMHDGCAETLHDRFAPACGGGDAHGKTSHLTQGEIDDLVAYLESL